MSKLLKILYKPPLKYYTNRQYFYIDGSCWVQNRTQKDSDLIFNNLSKITHDIINKFAICNLAHNKILLEHANNLAQVCLDSIQIGVKNVLS